MIIKSDTLLMFSGGLDSTGALCKLIEDGKKVHVHHMNLRNIEKRARAELRAVQKIIQHMNTVANFLYSESTYEYGCFNNKFMWDSDIVSFVAGYICASTPWIKEVAIGMTASDTNDLIPGKVERANKIFAAFGTEAVKIYPVKSLTKQQIYDMLPSELKILTWSCRTPIYNKEGTPFPCKKCHSCIESAKINK